MIEPLIKPRPPIEPPPATPPFAYVWQDVIDELRFSGRWRDDKFAVGLLVGHHYRDPDTHDSFVEVDGFIAATHVPDSSAFSRHLRQEWRGAGDTVRSHFGEAEVVGWFVAAPDGRSPGQGEFVLHNTFFSHPWHIGLWLAGDAAPQAVRVEDGRFVERPVAVLRGAEAPTPTEG